MPIAYKMSYLNPMSCVSICFIAPDFIAGSRRSDSGAPMTNRAWKKNANIAPQLCVADLFLHSRVFRGRKRAYHANISSANDFVNLKIHRFYLRVQVGKRVYHAVIKKVTMISQM